MQYMGGKSKIAKDISQIINNHTQGIRPFVSLFCGSCAIETKVDAKYKICNDKHEYLIAMWGAAVNGYIFPDIVTEEQYKYIKAHKDEDRALAGFVGFGCSFGGIWFQSIARSKGRNHADESKRALEKDIQGLQNTLFSCLDYKQVYIPAGAVVYCDPPYKETTGYTTGSFDHAEFWQYMRELSATHTVFISEEQAPADFVCVWEKSFTRTLDRNKENQPKKIERLFQCAGALDQSHF